MTGWIVEDSRRWKIQMKGCYCLCRQADIMIELEKSLWFCQQDIMKYKAVTGMNIDVCHFVDALIQRSWHRMACWLSFQSAGFYCSSAASRCFIRLHWRKGNTQCKTRCSTQVAICENVLYFFSFTVSVFSWKCSAPEMLSPSFVNSKEIKRNRKRIFTDCQKGALNIYLDVPNQIHCSQSCT